MTEWRRVLGGWPYEASDSGDIRHVETHELRPTYFDRYGYPRVYVGRVGKRNYVYSVHKLVAGAFHGPRPSRGHQVNHKNGIKTDNRAENLEWVTASENQQHAVRFGLFKDQKGTANPASKLSEDHVREIRCLRRNGAPIAEVARMYGIVISAVSQIANRKTWKHVA